MSGAALAGCIAIAGGGGGGAASADRADCASALLDTATLMAAIAISDARGEKRIMR
jgi:hypothetical protein